MVFLQPLERDHGTLASTANDESPAVIQILRLTARTPPLCHRAVTGLLTLAGGGLSIFSILSILFITPAAAASASEQSNLDVMIRQLNALENTARHSANIPDEPGQRYFFDYPRLAGDIARIRHGLQAYLTPSRAQPRDPVELSGQYTTQGQKP